VGVLLCECPPPAAQRLGAAGAGMRAGAPVSLSRCWHKGGTIHQTLLVLENVSKQSLNRLSPLLCTPLVTPLTLHHSMSGQQFLAVPGELWLQYLYTR